MPPRNVRLVYVDGREMDLHARAAASDPRNVGGDYGGDFWIAASRRVIDHQNDGLTRSGYLNRSCDNAVRHDVIALGVLERRAIKAISHAVRLERYGVLRRQKSC